MLGQRTWKTVADCLSIYPFMYPSFLPFIIHSCFGSQPAHDFINCPNNTPTRHAQRKARYTPAYCAGGLALLPSTDDGTHQKCGAASFSVSTPHIWPWCSLPTSQGSPFPSALTSQFNSSLEKQIYSENY